MRATGGAKHSNVNEAPNWKGYHLTELEDISRRHVSVVHSNIIFLFTCLSFYLDPLPHKLLLSLHHAATVQIVKMALAMKDSMVG